MIKSATYKCDWCEEVSDFEGPDSYEEAGKDGWIVMSKYPELELTFCGTDCLLSYL